MKFYLGIDGGQSSTEALIADENGNVLGRGLAGPCNHISGPEAVERFRGAMTQAVQRAEREADLEAGVGFESVCCGLSGGPEDKARHLRDIVPSRYYYFTHDAEIAWAGAFSGEPGIIVIAGTGSIAYGRNTQGREARAGGWGYIFGDEGGAFDLVRQALRSALRMEEGWGEATSLREDLLSATGAQSANQLLHRFYTAEYPRARTAGWAQIVHAAAQAGDAIATEILTEAASQLATYVAGVHKNLFGGVEPTQVAPIGGVFESELMRARFADAVTSRIGAQVHAPEKTPSEGAVLLAMRLTRNQAEDSP